MSQDGDIPTTIPREFVERYELERARVLRLRMAWYCGIVIAVLGLSVFGELRQFMDPSLIAPGGRAGVIVEFTADVLMLLIHGVALGTILTTRHRRAQLVMLASLVMGLTAAVSIIATPVSSAAGGTVFTKPGGASTQLWNAGLETLVAVFALHFLASLLISLSPKEGLRPLVPVLVLYAVVMLSLGEGPFWQRLVLVLVSPLAGLPGLAWSWWRHRSFNEKFTARVVAKKYGEVTRELSEARRVHEALFPPMVTRGPVRVHYRYEPASEIGGDFLFVRPLTVPPVEPSGKQVVVVIDVTGHGVPAALAVSRLHDELSRMFADGGWASPRQVIAGLNRFVIANLAPQRVYATAAVLECDGASGEVRYANAGHPASLLRTPGGMVKRLEPTAPMLGVLEPEVFEVSEREEMLADGASVILYTDGAIDTRATLSPDSALGIEGVERAARSAERGEPGAIADAIMRAVDEHRMGEPADDTLIVEVRRVVAS